MKKSSGRNWSLSIGHILYGLIFAVILTAYLTYWSGSLSHIRLPDVPETPEIGLAVAILGLIVMISGIWTIIASGDGLPLNTHPPKKYVRTGIYKWISHPIYLGFFALCAGGSIWVGSSGGLWVVTPVIALSCTALIWGYERPQLIGSFGELYFDHKIRLPQASSEKPEFKDFVSIVLLVYLPWLLVYQGIASYIGVVDPLWVSTLPFEEGFPVYEAFAIPYMLTYPIAIFLPLLAKTKNCQRKYCISVILALTVVIPFYLTFPIIAEFRQFEPSTIWGDLIILQHSVDNPATAFPAFHVVWGILGAKMLSDHFPKLKILFWIFAWLIALSCWFTGMHAILDVFAGAAVSFLVLHYEEIWHWLRGWVEKLGNSWRPRMVGPFRIINHFKYVWAATFIYIILSVSILGPEYFLAILIVCVIGVVFAAVWAQLVLSANNHSRSFGCYGCVIGVIIGVFITYLWFDLPWMISMSTFCIVAPFVIAIGRLRCLIQGCCHGTQATNKFGIIITEPNTRVCSQANLCGTLVHPTQFYSIVSNIFIGMVMFRMLMVGSQSANVVSVYLILSSLARFVEETYRGEPQTPKPAGLSIYQWFSIVGLFAGTVFTMIPSANFSFAGMPKGPFVWGVSIVFSTIIAFIMSVDIPSSEKRFARLT